MKTLKFKPFTVGVHIIALCLLLTTSCAQTGDKKMAQASIKAPKDDIHTSVISGNLQAVRQHIAAGTDINGKEPFGGSTPLITAATFNKQDIAKVLIEAGADLTIQNNDGSTALHTAAFFCRVEIVQLLMDVEADKTIRNNFGATPRETVMGPFAEIKPFYEMLQQQLAPMGLQLDMQELEKTRPVIAMMLQ